MAFKTGPEIAPCLTKGAKIFKTRLAVNNGIRK
jgi:hypothetical protein